MDNKFNFTKEAIEKLPRPEKKTKIYKDTKEHGLILLVYPSGNKYFYIARNINTNGEKKYYRKKIGIFPDLSISDARAKVAELKGQIALGHNPFEEEPEPAKEMTFKELLDIYIADYAVHKVKRWKYIINDMERQAKSFYDMGISTIKKPDIQKIFNHLSANTGKTAANRFIDRMSSIFNRAIEWELLDKNPTKGIVQNQEEKRNRYITQSEISLFLKALAEENNQQFEDFVLIALLTGARKSNVLSMEWKEVHIEETTWIIPGSKTKNGKDQPIHLVPWAMDILVSRKKDISNQSGWVFPSNDSKSGHFESPKRRWAKVLKRGGFDKVRIHDLRRTHGTWMRQAGADREIIGEALNHKDPKSTEHYDIIESSQVKEFREKAMANLMSMSHKKRENVPTNNIQNNSDYVEMLQRRIKELEQKLCDFTVA